MKPRGMVAQKGMRNEIRLMRGNARRRQRLAMRFVEQPYSEHIFVYELHATKGWRKVGGHVYGRAA